jgi:sensor histidine kinase YesM
MQKIVDFILRFKILHIAYWIYAFIANVHLLQINRPDEKHAFINYVDGLNNIAFQMLSVYICIYYLLPQYFKKEKYYHFGIASLLTIIFSALLNLASQRFYVPILMNHHIAPSLSTSLINLIAKIFDIGIITIIFIFILLVYFYYLKDQRNKQIEKERIMSELDFLKAQINPHFLFNALNSIYVLMKEDLKLSEQTLLKFSSLLRYQLYDCSNNQTTLKKEIEFLKDYIDLEKVRNSENRIVKFETPTKEVYIQIAPFILIPFVENAFKHISHFTTQTNTIEIKIIQLPQEMILKVENTFEENLSFDSKEPKGIGLHNVKRRLELLYPEKHLLEIRQEENIYSVTLSIQINEN